MSSMSTHIDPETLAAFAEGRLDAAKRDAVVAHIDRCEDCMDDATLVMSSATAESERRRFGRPSWLLALAAALVLAFALPFAWRLTRHHSATDELVSLSPRSSRIVEPRLTGGFPWAAYHGPMRAAGGSITDTERLKLGGAAGELMQRAEHDPSADAQHAAGVAMVLVDKPDEAIAKLESAARESHDAKSWSDLAAARYAAAVQFRRPSLYPEALAASDDALRIDAKLPEALFNRALILENMGLISEARKAWQRYLEIDPGSPWADEARDHLVKLPTTTGASRWERDQPLLEAAAAAGDARKTLALVDAYRERARRFAEAEYLGRWAEAEQRKNEVDATKWLKISRSIGNALVQLSGESLLRDAVRAIDNADAANRAKIAEAHLVYRRGRIAFSHDHAEAAERDLRAAAGLFESSNDPMSLVARHYAASAKLARNGVTTARAELERLRGDADMHSGYLALGGHLRWELARACKAEEDWSGEVAALTAAADLLRRAGERASEAFVEAMLASSHNFLGRPEEAWSAQILALNTEAIPQLFESTLGGAVRAEIQAGKPEAALAMLRISQSTANAGSTPVRSIEMLVQKAMLEAVTGDNDAAAQSATQADAILTRLTDADVKARQSADVDVVRGARLLYTDARRAEEALTRAIGYYQSHERVTSLPEPLLLRARCALRLGEQAGAEQDLEAGVQVMERHPLRLEGVVLGTGVLDAGNELFAEAIRLHLDRGDTASAFAYAERLHGHAITAAEVMQRLARSETVVLENVVLPDEIVTFAISSDDFRTVRSRVSLAKLVSLAARSDDSAAAELYDLLIRPFESLIAPAHSLIVIADPRLASVSFAALFDSRARGYLIEQLPVAMASSAASLHTDAAIRQSSTVAEIALPNGSGTGSAELPDAEKEIADIGGLYTLAHTIPAEHATWAAFLAAASSANIVHVAGHTGQEPGAGDQSLLFADASGTGVERISWKTIISAAPFRARTIVLAACQTLHAPPSAQARSLSLAAAFAARGADVIGTLRPIPDRDARVLFRSVHRQLAKGSSAAAAARAAQLEAIRSGTPNDAARAWRAIAVFTTHLSF